MPDFNLWLGDGVGSPLGAIDAAGRAADAWQRIQHWPSTVIFTRPKSVPKTGAIPAVQLPPQIVRIEFDNRSTAIEGAAGVAPSLKLIVYGIQHHLTLPSTDMEEGYSFVMDGDSYRCVNVLSLPGERQGVWEAMG